MPNAAEMSGSPAREDSASLQLFFYPNPLPMWIVDSASLVFLAVNDAALQNWECAREELLGRSVGDLAARENPRLPSGLRDEFIRASLARSEDNVPWRHRPKGGAWIDVKGACDRITFNGKGAVLIVIEDAPAPAQAALVGGTESFDLAAEAIIIRDLQHRVLFWSRGAERLYGWSAAEAIGADARHLFKDDHAHFARASSALLAHDGWNASVEQRRKDGGSVMVNSRWSLIRDPNGRPVSILIVDTDSAEVKKLRWQFLRAQRLHAIGTLAAGIAHDLNNILSPILMSVGLIRRISDDPGAQRMINIIEASAERGAGIVKQVFTFARAVDGEHVLLQPKHLVGDLAKMMTQTFPRNIDIQTEFPADLWTISGDPTQLHQVLLNLCMNAREAMPSGGTLTIGAENVDVDQHFAKMHPEARLGPHVVLRVSDTGIGMSPAAMAKIFEPFVTTKNVGEGSGLGLSATREIVRSHGGFITVQTELGAGSTFKVFTPAVKEAAIVEQKGEAPGLMRGAGQLVLVVDDEMLIREALVSTLTSNGYRAYTAEDGSDALALYFQRAKEIDVVLTDLSMGQMDGVTLIRSLRRVDPQVRVIVSSAQLQKETMAILTGLGVKAFLDKPYTGDKLLRTLQAVLAGGGGAKSEKK